jgi:phage shock protein A
MTESDRAVRSALVDAVAGEHRLRREALKEGQEAARWEQRATYAEGRGLMDLAQAARERATRHTRLAELLLERASELSLEVERLRHPPTAIWGGGRAPPAPEGIEARFAELEIEDEIAQIRARLGATAAAPNEIIQGAEPH